MALNRAGYLLVGDTGRACNIVRGELAGWMELVSREAFGFGLKMGRDIPIDDLWEKTTTEVLSHNGLQLSYVLGTYPSGMPKIVTKVLVPTEWEYAKGAPEGATLH